MACTLIARGKTFDVKGFLPVTRLPVNIGDSGVRGDRRLPGKPRYQDSGFCIWASRDEADRLEAAIPDVVAFLKRYKRALGRLARTAGVEHIMLDFTFDVLVGSKGIAIQGEYLPTDLLRLAGELNIGIGLSLRPPFEKSADKKSNRSISASRKASRRRR